MQSVTVAAVQASPVFLDLEATLDRACQLMAEVGVHGADLAVFPEGFVPGYPAWVWHVPAGQSAVLREAYAELHANAISIPGPETARLCAAARQAGTAVAIGVNERNTEGSGTTLYNTVVYIGADGTLLGRHRKLVPTSGEPLVWAFGDGSDLEVYDLPAGRMSGLICWENYMPLARYALYAWGVQIWVAPTWDCGEPWLSSMRHIAKEGRCLVVGCGSPLRRVDVPDRLSFKASHLPDREWINPGDSVIVHPDGKLLAGPAHETETILYASIPAADLVGPRSQLDVAGHYARPDLFELTVRRRPRPFLTVIEDDEPPTP
ncbi:MAG: carbon-nitrogen hydrolase family protein [Gemmatimonadota bacterium]|nr:carbon-nitrogen hydrolase family protein [Gemmatimonadota bacterium]